jgi:hypothetical protein
MIKKLVSGKASRRKKDAASDAATAQAEPDANDTSPLYLERNSVGNSNMASEISQVREINGFIGGCLVDIDSGMTLATEGGGAELDLEAAAAMNADFVKAKLLTMQTLGLKTHIEDILITLGTQIHLIRPLAKNQKVFLYVALDRKVANLGRARMQLQEIEGSLK